ncbi:hypothetical protein BWI93_05435, partial [Siphonobacter sp. BAB-5385]|uniref:hypothetical protein n=1 Tax=Siphonobacter sp. BAB-5385 TaxID=1864822 RepID=UPI000BD53327
MKAILALVLSLWFSYSHAQVELTQAKNKPGSNSSRTALSAVNGVIYGNDGNPFVLEARKFTSLAEVRSFDNPTAGVFYQVWLSNRLEFWKADLIDKTTPDNNLTTVVSSTGVRYKRFFSSLSSPLTTEFKGTWNASTNQPALTTT